MQKKLDMSDGSIDNKISSNVWNEYAKKNNLSEVAEDVTVDFDTARGLIEENLATKYGITAEELNQAKEEKNFGVVIENPKDKELN